MLKITEMVGEHCHGISVQCIIKIAEKVESVMM